MEHDADRPVEYAFCSGTDGELQLVAVDPDARWTVFEQREGEPSRKLRQAEAEGEEAYYRRLLGNPSWYLSRGDGWRRFIYVDGRPEPVVLDR